MATRWSEEPARTRSDWTFVLLAVAWIGGLQLVAGPLLRSEGFEEYLALNARCTAFVLRTFGAAAVAEGNELSAFGTSLRVAVGCDAVRPAFIYAGAVLAFPVSWRWRAGGLVAGVAALWVLNFGRIIGLTRVASLSTDAFRTLHVDVLPVVFVVLALVLWVLWARWALGARWSAA